VERLSDVGVWELEILKSRASVVEIRGLIRELEKSVRKGKNLADHKDQNIGLLKLEIKGLGDSKAKLKKKKELLEDQLKATEASSKKNLQRIWNLEEELRSCQGKMQEIVSESTKLQVLNENFQLDTKFFENTIQELEMRLLSEQMSRRELVDGNQFPADAQSDLNSYGEKILGLEIEISDLKTENRNFAGEVELWKRDYEKLQQISDSDRLARLTIEDSRVLMVEQESQSSSDHSLAEITECGLKVEKISDREHLLVCENNEMRMEIEALTSEILTRKDNYSTNGHRAENY
jgi:FtsZ-binding cell division protein ZapB